MLLGMASLHARPHTYTHMRAHAHSHARIRTLVHAYLPELRARVIPFQPNKSGPRTLPHVSTRAVARTDTHALRRCVRPYESRNTSSCPCELRYLPLWINFCW